MILILLLGATGLRIIRHSQNVPKKEWFLLGILLWVCTLTRQINAVLAALLPLTFVLLVLYRLSAVRFAGYQSCCPVELDQAVNRAFKKAMVAVAVGISSIVLANASIGVLCYAVKIPYHSGGRLRIFGRLKFLAALPVEQRNQLLAQGDQECWTPQTLKNLIYLLRNEFTGRTASWDIGAFKNSSQGVALSTSRGSR